MSGDVYVCLEPCGCLKSVCSASEDFKLEAAKIVAKWIRRGDTPSLISHEELMRIPWRCEHKESA